MKRIDYRKLTSRGRIDSIIRVIRESHPDIQYLYTHGQCWNFHCILKEILGVEIEPYHSYSEGHVYSKIGNFFWDIRGCHSNPPRDLKKMSDRMIKEAGEWGSRDRRILTMSR